MIRIKSASPLKGFRVRLTLSDGQIIERDLDPLLVGPLFEPVRQNRERFLAMTVEDGTIVWPGEIDLCPDMVIWGGPPPALSDVRAS